MTLQGNNTLSVPTKAGDDLILCLHSLAKGPPQTAQKVLPGSRSQGARKTWAQLPELQAKGRVRGQV